MKNQTHVFWIAAVPSILMVVLVALAAADSADVPNVFVPGQVANATHVNANFQECSRAIGDNDSRISALEQTQAPTHRMVCGTIDDDDSVLAGSGFTLTVTWDTLYTYYDIEFDTPFASRPVVMLEIIWNNGTTPVVEGVPGLGWAEALRVRVEKGLPGSPPVHMKFSFLAVAMD